ncbi:hypothetical protein SAMN02745146_3046 [Hymenobacter daecheongensis DSM 21074]|uniref:Uncharacterized protein n=1 Tax=Hymenobacter daecheongensis DSM 21074 TaxID=1121955 RepID=A0A1M6J0P0_9BACT|nr:hypothetical protein [Hymenobacter daecheongensis]SHJ40245.1 hypothetical protein SAMN02745146_3046 [Hymenobacter daecheongensis DSM 21074]
MIYGDQKDRDFLKRYIESLIGAINAIGAPHAGRQLPIPIIEKTYLDLFRRLKASLMGILAQLGYWPEYGEMKVPISLLFRSCVTDVLLLLFLKSLEQHEPTFENELHVLDTPYIKFVKGLLDADQLTTTEDAKQQALSKLYADAAYLIEETSPALKFKKSEVLRHGSDEELLKKGGRTFSSTLTTESQYTYLNKLPEFSSLSHLYWLYKHFSQHEHYSHAGSVIINLPQWFECLQWYKALYGCFRAVQLTSSRIGAEKVLIEDLTINMGHLHARLLEHQEDLAAASKQE